MIPVKTPMSELVMPRFPMGLTDLSVHLEDVSRLYKPLSQTDYENTIAVYVELLDHESWAVVEGAIYGLHNVAKGQKDMQRFTSIIEDLQFSHPSKVIRAITKTFVRVYEGA